MLHVILSRKKVYLQKMTLMYIQVIFW